ncbi:MAG: cobalamin-dependent protein, partial [Bacteroidales bacterium]|nr:cobalamin-dependent protein [Bacteroidales bacterium]
MKILLVSPVRDPHKFTNKGILIPQLALFILQGLTPKKHEVKLVEEEYMELDLEEECDVVAISCLTSNAYRGYRIADSFREKGKIVVMGGIHPSLLPDEALEHADAVVIGEAEGVWEKILDDIESGNLQERYHEPNPDLDRYIPKDFSTLSKKRMYNLVPLQTSRGCPYNCDFCCVSDIFGKKIKEIPIKHIVKDIEASGSRNYIF